MISDFIAVDITEYIGDKKLLDHHKDAFLCSREVPATIVLKCYDWAIAQHEAGNCVIRGFHSVLEKICACLPPERTQHVIVALAKGMQVRTDPEFKNPHEQAWFPQTLAN